MTLQDAYIHLLSGLTANSELYRIERAKYSSLKENKNISCSFNDFYTQELKAIAEEILTGVEFYG